MKTSKKHRLSLCTETKNPLESEKLAISAIQPKLERAEDRPRIERPQEISNGLVERVWAPRESNGDVQVGGPHANECVSSEIVVLVQCEIVLKPGIQTLFDVTKAATEASSVGTDDKSVQRISHHGADSDDAAADEPSRLHQLKKHLFDATLLLITVCFAFEVLGQHIAHLLPILASRPTAAAVTTGSALAIAMRILLGRRPKM